MKWWKMRFKIVICVFLLICIAFFLWIEEVRYYPKKIFSTEFSLQLARKDVERFKEINNRLPMSLSEINTYAIENPNSHLREIPFGEYITDIDGNREEYGELNGKGGLFYNPNTGEVKVNLTKSVGHYLRLYFGKQRNEIPAEW